MKNIQSIEKLVSKDYLRHLFTYKDGMLFRKNHIYKTANGKIGDRVGGLNAISGYRDIKLFKRPFREHRAIWIYNYGNIPDGMLIDHINGIKTDNRIENLRTGTSSQNQQNRSVNRNNKHGYKGVSSVKGVPGKLRAQIILNGVTTVIGWYDSPELAAAAYNEAAKDKFGAFALLNKIPNQNNT